MTVIIAMFPFTLIVIVGLFLYHARETVKRTDERERELLTRIQHPQLVPVPSPKQVQVPDPTPDESNLVGMIDHWEGSE